MKLTGMIIDGDDNMDVVSASTTRCSFTAPTATSGSSTTRAWSTSSTTTVPTLCRLPLCRPCDSGAMVDVSISVQDSTAGSKTSKKFKVKKCKRARARVESSAPSATSCNVLSLYIFRLCIIVLIRGCKSVS